MVRRLLIRSLFIIMFAAVCYGGYQADQLRRLVEAGMLWSDEAGRHALLLVAAFAAFAWSYLAALFLHNVDIADLRERADAAYKEDLRRRGAPIK